MAFIGEGSNRAWVSFRGGNGRRGTLDNFWFFLLCCYIVNCFSLRCFHF